MEFVAKHWDKLVAILLSTVIAGVIGFFSAVASIKGQIGNLEAEVRVLQTLVTESQRQEITRLNETCKNLNERMFEVNNTTTRSITLVQEIQGTIDIRVLNAINNQMSRAELARAPR
jgi:hypothetical protein